MADVRTILPTGSTELERVIDTTFPRGWAALADSADPLAMAGDTSVLSWLAVQWQVAQFAPYIATVEELLDQAVPWLMERGSAASLRRALGWLGYTAVNIDEAGAWLHIDVGQVPSQQDIAAIVHVVRESLPAHVRFYRIFHGHDVRPIVLDRGPALDVGMLDGYSGVPGAHGLLESFGIRRGGTLPAATAKHLRGAPTQVRVSVARYDDMPVLDAWHLDSRVLAATSGGVMELAMFATTAPPAGGGVRVRSQSVARATAWTAPAPMCAATLTTAHQAAEPVHPPRHWGGPWGGPWREHFQLISTEET
ncbi:phage tail protein [Diaphorobacter sp.]|uniref:phage tail protein n=1 Tax=Diaphorobacter sp. TaxID=1934310 RepID=UPI00258F6853|nr:phage tail protein [Diaphorobacter sp.]